MYDPVTGFLLSDPFLHQRLFTAKQFHRQLVVGRLEKGLQLIFDETLLSRLAAAGAAATGPGAAAARRI